MTNYRGMTISDGVSYIESKYTNNQLKNVNSFSDLHELRDANMTLPFPEDCNDARWLSFANAVIESFDRKFRAGEIEGVGKRAGGRSKS